MTVQILSRRVSSTTSRPCDDITANNEENGDAEARASAAVHISSSPMSAMRCDLSPSPKISSTVSSAELLKPYQLTQDEIDFIVRTETSSWYAQSEPIRVHEGVPGLSMEPRLHRRSPSSGGSSLRRSADYSTTMGRTMSWTSGGNRSRTSVDSQNLLNAGPKRASLALKAEMPSQSLYSYGNNNGMGNGKGDGQKRASLLRRQGLSSATSAGPPLKNYPGEAFRNLPKEIILMIITELWRLHLDGDEKRRTCPSCYLRDLCSLALSSRKLNCATRERLYETIMLAGPDSAHHIKKRFKIKCGTRLKLLRRTLRAHPELAEMVKTLRVPTHTEAGATGPKTSYIPYEDIVASVIMACPNLERIVGFYPRYDYEFSRITQALSTRTKLTEHLWIIDGNVTVPLSYTHAALKREHVLSEHARTFISHHSRWDSLSTLAIHCTTTSTFDASVIRPILSRLPSLQHLALSSFSLPSDFILHLPPLSSLHLSAIPIATPETLIDLTRAPLSSTLSSLTLSLLPPDVLSLPIIARILSSISTLSRLSFSSPTALTLPIGTSVFLHPYLASSALEFLHWDVPSPSLSSFAGADRSDSNYILAKAIAMNGFPKLRRLRAPKDVDGLLQRVCRPSRGFDIPITSLSLTGSAAVANGNGSSQKNGSTLTRRRKGSVSSTSSSASGANGSIANGDLMPGPGLRLRESRQAAQARIEIARLRPRWRVVCEDWSRRDKVRITARFEVGGFVGRIGSQVVYWLEDDGMGGIESLIRGRAPPSEECSGRWNARKEEKKGWRTSGPGLEWHTPRERGWRNEGLDGLF